jgi:uroporphyrinogen decarboxylase
MMDMVDFSLRLVDEPDFVRRLLAAATVRAIQVALTLVEAGVDAIVMDTDYCHQTGPWVSPAHFEEMVLPLLKKTVDAVHDAGAYVIKHTDGHTWPILDMLVSAGIDGLHGIQPSAGMDLTALKEKYGPQVALFGAVEGSYLINSQPQQIRQLVHRQIVDAGKGGSYVLTSANSIQLGVPPENYLAMLEARREYGRYPLR